MILTIRIFLMAAGLSASAATDAGPPDIKIIGRAIVPENVTSAKDGTIYIGSFESGGIYRASPGEQIASRWVSAEQVDAGRTLGLWVDGRDRRLLACVIDRPLERGGKPRSSSIKAFGLDDAKLRTAYPLDAGGICNDITVAADGTSYTTDMAGRIFRRRAGEGRFSLWFEDTRLMGADGLALMVDRSLLVSSIRQGTLHRIPMKSSGEAGVPVGVALDRPLEQPDGMRRVGPDRFLVAESAGRLTELSISNDRASTRIIRDGLRENPSGVTLVGRTAYVSLANWPAFRDPNLDKGESMVIAVPYPYSK